MRILVVEDDTLLGRGIQAGLGELGFAADWVRDGLAARAALEAATYAAVVLDLGLPRVSGLEVLRGMREGADRTPVLVLTANDAVKDRIQGLDRGADDYMIKPFDLHELAARLRALVRRAGGEAAPLLHAAGVELDPAKRSVRYQGEAVDLSGREFDVLHELMLAAGRVLSREQIVERIYSWGEDIESNAVEVHVHHLRRKLAPEVIRTLRGVGYLLPRESGG
jgi:two-component system OmpR family response regulator/two-component system response regulator QseB